MTWGGGCLGPVGSILRVIRVVLNDYALVVCDVFEGKAEYGVSAGK